MKIDTFGLLALAASTSAVSVQLVKNYCPESFYLTISVNVTEDMNGPFLLPSGQAYTSDIIGEGNTALVTKFPDVFGANVAKLVLGTSTTGILYWAINNTTGDPMEGQNFNVTSSGVTPDVCQNATSYDGMVHACTDDGVTLTLNLCAAV